MKKYFVFLLIALYPAFTHAQSKTAKINGDCISATEIIPEGNFVFKASPKGPGNTVEYKNNPYSSLYTFTEEQNSAWFTFETLETGDLTFLIQPKDTLADFDFLLYEYTDENFCNQISTGNLKPVRSNISRFNPLHKSKTGLSLSAKNTHVQAGEGPHLSSAISVKKGQRYYLVINEARNVDTPFRILFKTKLKALEEGFTVIKGTLMDEETGKPITNATVTVEEKTGKVITQTISDSKTGRYILTLPVVKKDTKKTFVVVAEKKGHFYSERNINVNSYAKTVPLNLVLPVLKKGNNISVHNILFEGNVATTLPSAKGALKHLHKLMKKNPSLFIQISGHTNGCSNGQDFSDQLSKKRAQTVKSYLVKKGIDQSRIETKGYGCTKMLYPIESSEKLQSKNRRVEILVLSY
jgi:outer membrane protein OmpA-like peptidoglycan-associated protein